MPVPLAIIIINWNGLADTRKCLLSLQAARLPAGCDVVLVDNGSVDDSVAVVVTEFPWVSVLPLGHNAGFAGGNNVGIRHALQRGAEHVLLLNNDTVVAPDAITELLRAAEQHPDVAAFGAKILCLDKPDVIWFAGGALPEHTLGPIHYGDGQTDSGQCDAQRRCTFLTGCVMLVRASAFQSVGLLDEASFFLWEDADWCARCAELGLPLLYVPTARIWHKGSASTGGLISALTHYYYERNHLRFVRRFQRSRLPREVLSRLLMLARNIAGGVWRALRGKPPQPLTRGALWRFWCAWLLGIVDFLRGRSGIVPPSYEPIFRGRRRA